MFYFASLTRFPPDGKTPRNVTASLSMLRWRVTTKLRPHRLRMRHPWTDDIHHCHQHHLPLRLKSLQYRMNCSSKNLRGARYLRIRAMHLRSVPDPVSLGLGNHTGPEKREYSGRSPPVQMDHIDLSRALEHGELSPSELGNQVPRGYHAFGAI